jgi:hypothetical protein
MEKLPVIIAVVGPIVAVAGAFVAVLALKTANQVASTNMFLELRRSYLEIQAGLDPQYREENWEPRDHPEAMRSLEKYWLHTFTEWFATTRLNKSKLAWLFIGRLAWLWKEFYSKAIVGGLRNEPLRITLCDMLYGDPGSGFSGLKEDFMKEMESLYMSKKWERPYGSQNGEPLKEYYDRKTEEWKRSKEKEADKGSIPTPPKRSFDRNA